MIATHERFVTDDTGKPVEVLVSLAEWQRLRSTAAIAEDVIFSQWATGEIATGNAARQLGLSYADFLMEAGRRKLSAFATTVDELEATLGLD
jgi:hypothetical protein